jgi:hypothetical protein
MAEVDSVVDWEKEYEATDGFCPLKHISRFAPLEVLSPSLNFVNLVITTTKPTKVNDLLHMRVLVAIVGSSKAVQTNRCLLHCLTGQLRLSSRSPSRRNNAQTHSICYYLFCKQMRWMHVLTHRVFLYMFCHAA